MAGGGHDGDPRKRIAVLPWVRTSFAKHTDIREPQAQKKPVALDATGR